jgi:orotate phosphoribosyltransferase
VCLAAHSDSASTLPRAVESELDCKVVRVVTLVDRMQGAAELFAREGYPFSPVFTAEELGITRAELDAELESGA